MRADRGFDPAGDLLGLPAERRDRSLGLFVEYGLTDRFTLRAKGDWQSGEDAFVDYEGRGPLEIGLVWQAWRDDRSALSLSASYANGGEGRNAGYALPGQGDQDWEVRAAYGRSFGTTGLTPPIFVEGQAARRLRDGLPDETRVDLTLGSRFATDWMGLVQAYGGEADGGARWVSAEASLVRDFGPWSLQAGWRETLAGRETPKSGGPVVALWRRF